MSLLGDGQSRGPSGILIRLDLPGTPKASEASVGGQLPAPPSHGHAAGQTAEAVAACAHLFMLPVLGWVSLPRNSGFSWSLTALGESSCGLSGQWVQRAQVGCTCSRPQAPCPTSGQSAEGSWWGGGVTVPGPIMVRYQQVRERLSGGWPCASHSLGPAAGAVLRLACCPLSRRGAG